MCTCRHLVNGTESENGTDGRTDGLTDRSIALSLYCGAREYNNTVQDGTSKYTRLLNVYNRHDFRHKYKRLLAYC